MLQSVTDIYGRVTTFTWLNGYLSSLTDAAQQTIDILHDSTGRLTSITSSYYPAAGPQVPSVTDYTYDSAGRIVSISDSVYYVTTLTYDEGGRLSQAILPGGATRTFDSVITQAFVDPNGTVGTSASPATIFDPSNAKATWTDPLGGVQESYVDSQGNVVRLVAVDGSETNYVRDVDGRVISITRDDPDGSGPLTAPVTVYTYDANGRRIQTVRPGGATESWSYDSLTGQRLTHTDVLGAVTTYAWNADRTLASVTDVSGGVTSFTYNGYGNVLTETWPDPDGSGPDTSSVISYVRDAFGRATSTTVAGITTSRTYDTVGRVTSTTDALSHTTTYVWTDLGRLSSITSPDPDGVGPLTASQATFVWDWTGRMLSQTGADGNTVQLAYDAAGNLASRTLVDPDGSGPLTDVVTSWTYDALGRQLTATDPLGNVSSVTYDAAGRILTTTAPDPDGAGPLAAAVTSFAYDAAGRLIQQTDGLGNATGLAYDAAGNRFQTTGALGNVSVRTFDAAGRVTATTDPLGNTTSFVYDAAGRLLSSTTPDPDGAGPLTALQQIFTRDVLGRLIADTNPAGLTTDYAYDSVGNLVSRTVIDPDGAGPLTDLVASWTYDAAGRQLSETDTLGNVSSVSYDALGRVLTATSQDPDGSGPLAAAVTHFGYNDAGQLIQQSDALGGVTSFAYDAAGNQDQITDALGNVRVKTFDAVGRVTSTTDALGRTTTFAYDNVGRLLFTTLPDPDDAGPLPTPQRTFTSRAGDVSPLISSVSFAGTTESQQYDALGRVISRTATDGSTTAYSFDAAGQLVSVTGADPDGTGPLGSSVTSFTYDAVGRTIQQTAHDGSTTSSAYNDFGQRVSVTDGEGRTNSFSFDGFGRRVQTTDALGNVASTVYDDLHRVTSVSDELDNVTSYAYDNLSRLISQTDATGGTTSNAYDALGRRTSLTDPLSNVTSWTYDAVGQLLSDTNQNGEARSYSYDAAGQLASRTDRNGRVITFGYDNLGRQTQQQWMDAAPVAVNTIATTYNADLRVASITDDDSAYAFTWDDAGRLLTTDNAGTAGVPNVVLTSVYDALGRQTSLTATIDGTADFVNTYVYDVNDRVTSLTQTDGSPTAGSVVSDKRVGLTYDNSGRFSTITRYEDLTATDEIATSTYGYDATGRLSSLNHTTVVAGSPNPVTLSGYAWTWDSADRITSYTSVLDGSVAFGYDSTGQLTSEARTDTAGTTVTSTFSYDANGNRTSASEPGTSVPGSYTTGTNNRTLSDGTYNYEYDAEGNRTKKTTIATGDYVEYQWNHANVLTDVVYKDSQGTTTKTVTYQYDALGRRIGKSVDDTGDGSVDRSQSFIYDGAGLLAASGGSITISGPNGSLNQHGWVDNLVLVFEDSDGDDSGLSTLGSRLLHGPAIDQVFAQESASGDVLWALADHQGTIKAWVESADFDGDGTVETQIINHLQFDAFGNILAVTDDAGTATTLDSRLTVLPAYTGQIYDADAELYYYRARWYDPAIGRFVSEDPLGFDAGDANVSRLVGNGVTVRSDPSGLDWLDDYAGWYDDTFGTAGEIATSAAEGVVVGAAVATVVVVAAPVVASAGAATLVAAGVSAATATTVATGTVTGTIFVAGTVGAVSIGVDTVQAIDAGDYNQAAFNIGMLGGGTLVGVAGGGQHLANAMPRPGNVAPSAAPNTWNPITIIAYELQNVYQPSMGPPGLVWMATAPTPASGGAAAAGCGGLIHIPEQIYEVLEVITEIWDLVTE